MVKKVKAWAIWHKHKDMITEVGFIDCGNFKVNKSMFTHENGVPAWNTIKYKLIPCEIIYEVPPRPKPLKQTK